VGRFDEREERRFVGRQPPPTSTARDQADLHLRMVFRAYIEAQPVRVNGLNQYIKAIYSQDGYFTDIYLAGDAKAYKPEDIELIKKERGVQ
jgi:hypothetical protein